MRQHKNAKENMLFVVYFRAIRSDCYFVSDKVRDSVQYL